MLHLIRHGKTVKRADRPAEEWPLDPAGLGAMRDLRNGYDWAAIKHWYSSPERKAIATAEFLTSESIVIADGLGEARRGGWSDDYDGLVERFLASPADCPAPGWERACDALGRFDQALCSIALRHQAADVA